MSAWPDIAYVITYIGFGAIINVVAVAWYLSSFKKKTENDLKWIKAVMRDHDWVAPNGDS